jgi:hypothetical protein
MNEIPRKAFADVVALNITDVGSGYDSILSQLILSRIVVIPLNITTQSSKYMKITARLVPIFYIPFPVHPT